MAFQTKPAATMTFTLLDASGSKSTASFNVPSGTLASAALAAAGVMRGLLANVTGCAILSQSLTYTQEDDAPELPVAKSRVERKGVFIFRTANARTARIEIPGITDGLVLESGRIEEDNVNVAALVTAMIAADALYCSADGSDLRSLKEAYERFRSTKPGQMPASRTPDRDALPEVIDNTTG